MFTWNSVRSFALTVSFVVIPFVVAAPLVVAQDAPPALTKAREQFSTAAVKGDKMAAERLTTVDHVWVDRAGRVRDKKTWLQEMAPAAGKNLSTDIRMYPGGAIVVTQRQGSNGESRTLQVWVQQGGEWKMAAIHGVPVGPSKSAQPVLPSSPLPANSGAAADIKAIETAIEALSAGNQRGDAKNFAASVTDRFVGVTVNGLSTKQSRVETISNAKPQPVPNSTVEQISTRVYGDLAITNRVNRDQEGRTVTTIVHVRQNGKWLRAGIAFTPATSK